MQIAFTDAERAFADSAEGRAAISSAARHHSLQERHKGAAATPWNDAMAADVVRRAAASAARNRIAQGAQVALADAGLAQAQADADRARIERRERISAGRHN